jgi:hypothetical protein
MPLRGGAAAAALVVALLCSLCLVGLGAARLQQQWPCTCANQSLCLPLQTVPPAKEVWAFAYGPADPTDPLGRNAGFWDFDWDLVTSTNIDLDLQSEPPHFFDCRKWTVSAEPPHRHGGEEG